MSTPQQPDPPGPAEATPAPRAARPLGHAVARGSTWLIVNTAATKGLSLLAQVVLATLLSKHDFGIYAIALSVSMFTAILKDGGVRQLLIQRQAEYDRLLGPVFWMALALNVLTAAIMAGAAPLAARVYGEPQLAPMLWVIALSIPLSTPGALLAVRLNIDLRFRALAAIYVVVSVIRYLGSIALAAAGAGPLAFVLPLPVIALVEWALTWWVNRERLWSRAPRARIWPSLFSQSVWVLGSTFAIGLINMGNYMAVGLVVPEAVVGVYFFAAQIVMQVGVLLGGNMNQVLFPALTKMAGDQARQRLALQRSIRQLMLVGAPLSMVLAPVFPHLEHLVWGGRWEPSVRPVQIIALLFPLTVILAAGHAALQAWGQFRRLAILLVLQGLGMLVSGVVGAWIGGDAISISLASSAYMALATLVFVAAAVRPAGLRARMVVVASLPAWAVGLAAAGAGVLASLCLERLLPAWPGAFNAIVHLVVSGGVFSIVFLALSRLIMARHLHEALLVVPQRFRPVAGSMLGLRPAEPANA